MAPTSQAAATVPWATLLTAHLRNLLGDTPQTEAIIGRVTRSLRPSSATNYANHVTRFAGWCLRQPDPPSPLPATVKTVLRWLEDDVVVDNRVKEGSLQPYLSAINKWHRDLGCEPPAIGDLISSWRSGLAHDQTDEGREVERTYLPAEHVSRVHEAALRQGASTASDCELLRARVATVVNFIFFARGATGAALLDGDIRRADGALHVTLRHEKTKWRSARSRVLTLRDERSIPGLTELLDRWLAVRGKVRPDDSFWALPHERRGGRAAVTFRSTAIDEWLRLSLASLSLSPPPGESWSGHSERKGAASASAAIGVSLDRICWCGGWKIKSATVHDYIDPTCPPTPAAYRYFGWLRPGLMG